MDSENIQTTNQRTKKHSSFALANLRALYCTDWPECTLRVPLKDFPISQVSRSYVGIVFDYTAARQQAILLHLWLFGSVTPHSLYSQIYISTVYDIQ